MTFLDENDLEASFPYLDNVTICSKVNDASMEHFLKLPNARTSVITLKSFFFDPASQCLWIHHRGGYYTAGSCRL